MGRLSRILTSAALLAGGLVLVTAVPTAGTPYGGTYSLPCPDGFEWNAETRAEGPDGSFFVAIQCLQTYEPERVNDQVMLLVLKLDADGQPDPSYGEGGSATVPMPPVWYGAAAFPGFSVSVDSAGRLLFLGHLGVSDQPSAPIGCPAECGLYVARVDAEGQPDAGFGDGGRVPVPGLDPLARAGHPFDAHDLAEVALSVDPRDRPLLVLAPPADSAFAQTHSARVHRWTPTGAPDPAFDGNGVLRVRNRTISDVFMSLTSRSSLLLGAIGDPCRVRPGCRRNHPLLLKIGPEGDVVRRFGTRGVAALPPAFGPRVDAAGPDRIIDHGPRKPRSLRPRLASVVTGRPLAAFNRDAEEHRAAVECRIEDSAEHAGGLAAVWSCPRGVVHSACWNRNGRVVATDSVDLGRHRWHPTIRSGGRVVAETRWGPTLEVSVAAVAAPCASR